jgi:hypothetical protein
MYHRQRHGMAETGRLDALHRGAHPHVRSVTLQASPPGGTTYGHLAPGRCVSWAVRRRGASASLLPCRLVPGPPHRCPGARLVSIVVVALVAKRGQGHVTNVPVASWRSRVGDVPGAAYIPLTRPGGTELVWWNARTPS